MIVSILPKPAKASTYVGLTLRFVLAIEINMSESGPGALTMGSWPVAISSTCQPGSCRTRWRITAIVGSAGALQSINVRGTLDSRRARHHAPKRQRVCSFAVLRGSGQQHWRPRYRRTISGETGYWVLTLPAPKFFISHKRFALHHNCAKRQRCTTSVTPLA